MAPEPAPTPYDAELMAAVTDLGSALRELVDASVLTTDDAAELTAAAARAREITTALTASTRPLRQLPALDDPIAFRRVYSPGTGVTPQCWRISPRSSSAGRCSQG